MCDGNGGGGVTDRRISALCFARRRSISGWSPFTVSSLISLLFSCNDLDADQRSSYSVPAEPYVLEHGKKLAETLNILGL
jgi:hypothetical protein